jgi:hypothetical protein
MVKERTDDDYHEVMVGNDGTQEINGQTWWYSPIIQVYVINKPPERPNRPSGPSEGRPGEEYIFYTDTSDPDGNQVLYQWDWGDGTLSEWFGPYDSGEEVLARYTWSGSGNYKVKVKAKDTVGDESPWSSTLSINIPRSRAASGTLFLRFLDNFPIISRFFNFFREITNPFTIN